MKKSINYKYLNILLILGNIYLLYLMKNAWLDILTKVVNILLPFIVAFCLSYILHPIVKLLVDKKIPKMLAIIITIVIILSILGLILYYLVPLFISQLISILSVAKDFVRKTKLLYDIDINFIQNIISFYQNNFIKILSELIKKGVIFEFISKSGSYLANVIIILITTIYFLYDMENIQYNIKNYLLKVNKKIYRLISKIDKELRLYLKGLEIFMLVQFTEYTILFFIIGHPNFVLIGILSGITTPIPYFGGLITNIIALLSSILISKKLFIFTLIIMIIFPIIDEYIISPKIYAKTNKISAAVSIFSVFAFGALFGFIGMVVALPITIVIILIIKFYKKETTKNNNSL